MGDILASPQIGQHRRGSADFICLSFLRSCELLNNGIFVGGVGRREFSVYFFCAFFAQHRQ